ERGVTGFGLYKGSAGGISLSGVGGSPTTAVLITIDGKPQYMGITGHHLPDAYVASDIERVEVIRGSASTLYGSNAMGGVINLITKKQLTEGVSARAILEYGSYNTQKYMVGSGYRKNGFNSYISVNHDRTDGHRPFSKFKITNGYIKLGQRISSKFALTADASIAKYYTTDPGTLSDPATDNSRWVDILRGMTSLTLTNTHGSSNGAINLFANFGRHKLYYGWDSKDYNFGAQIYQSFVPFKGNITTSGIDVKRYGGEANNFVNEKIKYPTKYINELAGYLTTQQNLFNDKLTLNAGVRYDHNSTFGNRWVPQGGVAYRPFEHAVIKASVAQGFRNPTINEMYILPPKSEDLRAEQLVTYDLSYSQTLLKGKLRGEITGYIASGSNMIKTLIIGGKPSFVNTGSFNNAGVEVSLWCSLTKSLSLNTNYSYLSMKEPIIATPTHKFMFSATYNISKFTINAQLQTINGLYTQIAPTIQHENYALLDASVSYKVLKWMELFVNCDNITNENYQINYDYPMPGIVVLGGIKFALSSLQKTKTL
ncbi:MAG: TonB-dependent receptor, partial [Rikenellaceae bacterium]